MSTPVIELVRVSTQGQAAEDRAGIPAQREINRRTARTYGLRIVKSIEIVDVSGAAVLASPEMQELLRLIESPVIQGVVTKEFSRLIRPEKYTDLAILEVFIDTRTILFLPDGPIDLASKSGRFLGTIRAAVAGLERREILDRMQDAKEAIRRAGRHPGGRSTLPLGVGYSKAEGWHFTADAEKVREAFRLFLSGTSSYTEIGRRLNIPRSSVRCILENETFTGTRVYSEKRDPSSSGYVPRKDGRQGYRKKIPRVQDEIIRVPIMEGIISKDDFSGVQRLIELKRRKHWRNRANTPQRYTYNGFLTCGDCGELLYTHTAKRDFYICKTRHTRERRNRALRGLQPCGNKYMLRQKLEAKINSLLSEKLQDSEFLRRVLEEFKTREAKLLSSEAAPVDRAAIEEKIASLNEKKERILESFFEGVIDRHRRDIGLDNVRQEIDVYEKLLYSSPILPGQRCADWESAMKTLEPFAEWEFLKREDKRSLLQHLCPEIVVFQYTIKSLMLSLGNRREPEDCDNLSHSKMDASRSRAPLSP